MRDRYDPTIVVTGWHRPPAAEGQLWLKLRAPLLPMRNFAGFLLHLIPTMVRLIPVVRGAVAINAHFIGPESLPLLLLRKLGLAPPVILSVHGADVTEAAGAVGHKKRIFTWLYANADCVVACSGALAAQVRAISPRAKVTAIWNGVSPPRESALESPLTSPYLVSVAAFVKKKGHDTLLHGFKQIVVQKPELKLIMIGADGAERQPILDLISQLGLQESVEIHLALQQSQVWRWVQHAECFVHAAREEPFGLALLEAALMSTPVVTTAVGGIKEYLVHGVHGLTYEPDRPDQLAVAVLDTLNDSARTERRTQAFRGRAATFTWQAAWDKYAVIAGIRQPALDRPAELQMRREASHSPR